MKKIALFVMLIVALSACTPVLPSRNQTVVEAPVVEENVSSEPIAEENVTETVPEPQVAPAVETDLRDVPRKEVTEGDLVSFPNLKAVDPDGDPIKYTFTEPLSVKGEWKTVEGDAGEHLITITASDGSNTVEQKVLLVVLPKNKPPMISLEEPIDALEGTTFTLSPNVTDPDGDPVSITFEGWMTTATAEVGYNDSGLHKVVIVASDEKGVTKKEVIVSVKNVNRAPQFSESEPFSVKENQRLVLRPSAKDPDGDKISYTFEEPFDESGSWTPAVGDAGDYDVIVVASDGELTSEQVFPIVVEAVNRAPVIELANPITVKEGETVTLVPVISDHENDEVRVSYSGWMNSDTRITTYDDAGNYKVIVKARDSAGNEAVLEVIVSVEDVNRAPIFGAGSFN